MEISNSIPAVPMIDKSAEYLSVKETVKTKDSVNELSVKQTKFTSNKLKKALTPIDKLPEDIANAVITEINKKINRNTNAQFSYHEKTNRIMIKIVDSQTQEIIKEIPPEKTLDMIAKILELVGILVDDRK